MTRSFTSLLMRNPNPKGKPSTAVSVEAMVCTPSVSYNALDMQGQQLVGQVQLGITTKHSSRHASYLLVLLKVLKERDLSKEMRQTILVSQDKNIGLKKSGIITSYDVDQSAREIHGVLQTSFGIDPHVYLSTEDLSIRMSSLEEDFKDLTVLGESFKETTSAFSTWVDQVFLAGYPDRLNTLLLKFNSENWDYLRLKRPSNEHPFYAVKNFMTLYRRSVRLLEAMYTLGDVGEETARFSTEATSKGVLDKDQARLINTLDELHDLGVVYDFTRDLGSFGFEFSIDVNSELPSMSAEASLENLGWTPEIFNATRGYIEDLVSMFNTRMEVVNHLQGIPDLGLRIQGFYPESIDQVKYQRHQVDILEGQLKTYLALQGALWSSLESLDKAFLSLEMIAKDIT